MATIYDMITDQERAALLPSVAEPKSRTQRKPGLRAYLRSLGVERVVIRRPTGNIEALLTAFFQAEDITVIARAIRDESFVITADGTFEVVV